MGLAEVRGNHAERFPTATEQRRGLYRAKAGGGGNRTVRCKVRMGQNIFYDDPLGALQGPTTGSAAFVHGAEMVEKLVPEAALRHDLQRLSSLIVQLNISEVSALQCNGGIEDLLQQRM